MSDKTTEKLPCYECYSTYLDEKHNRRCEFYKHKTDGYFAESICIENGRYDDPEQKNSEGDKTPCFDIFR